MKIKVGECYRFDNTIFKVVEEWCDTTRRRCWEIEILVIGDFFTGSNRTRFYENSEVHRRCKTLNRLTRALYEN